MRVGSRIIARRYTYWQQQEFSAEPYYHDAGYEPERSFASVGGFSDAEFGLGLDRSINPSWNLYRLKLTNNLERRTTNNADFQRDDSNSSY